jgi:hypothetical protein
MLFDQYYGSFYYNYNRKSFYIQKYLFIGFNIVFLYFYFIIYEYL